MVKITAAAGLFVLVGLSAASAQSLAGSRAAMVRQNSVAQDLDLTFLRTAADVREFVEKGLLVPVRGNAYYEVGSVSFPYARPAVRMFVERISAQYHDACAEKLVITSLTRPISRQPRNAHELSVHPTGMAVDLRVSNRASCRRWLEGTLQELEAAGVLDATRERRPAHYHIAVFPASYNRYVARLTGTTAAKVAASTASPGMKIARADGPSYASVLPVGGTAAKASGETYTVRRGDSLWLIARRLGMTVAELKSANGMSGSTIKVGQKLRIPPAAAATADEPPNQ